MFAYEDIRNWNLKNVTLFIMAKMTIQPTESELEILQVLWEKGPSTVRTVHDILSRSKIAGYTTTLKLMQIMHEKGLVKRDTTSRSHVYEAAISQERTRKAMVDKLIKNLFQGSSSRLVMQALGHHQATKEELKAIKQYLNELERKK